MENSQLKNEQVSSYEKLKHTPPELRTSRELSDAIKQDIRCIGLIPEGMLVEGIPVLSRQEIEDIRMVSKTTIMEWALSELPSERRTQSVCQAAVNADCTNLKYVPENMQSNELVLSVLRTDGSMINAVDENKRTPEMYMTAIESSAIALMIFPKEVITPEIAMKSIQKDGLMLEYVPENIKNPDMCRAALKSSKEYDYEVIEYVPFPKVCLEYLKKIERENGDPFMVFGSIKPEIITPEMAQLAVKLDPSCIQFVPDQLKTPKMCADAVGKDWRNMRFLPEKMKTKEICELAMNLCILAQQYVPRRNLTPEMYLYPMKVSGLDLEYVPENHRTPEVCLQAVMSNRHANVFLPKWTDKEFNIYDFYQKFKNENIIVEYLSFEQIQKVFKGETVHLGDIRISQYLTLKDFTIHFDRNTNRITVKSIEGTGRFEKMFEKMPFLKKIKKDEKTPKKRKGIRM